jgi:hypothetical protein
MSTATELLRQGRRGEIWQKYCGFIDLSLEEFMDIQRRLLLEQIDMLGKCELGRKILGSRVPASVEEFRERVPLTTYEAYEPYLAERREDVLPSKPHWWIHTSGRSGGGFRWAPFSEEAAKRLGECMMGVLVLAASSNRGEFTFESGETVLFTLAPYPYISGAVVRGTLEEFDFTYMPPPEKAEQMGFQERIEEGFSMALKSGLGVFYGMASVLVRIGERFSQGAGSLRPSSDLLHPRLLGRIVRALIRSRLDGRRFLLPKDLWDVKCIATGGADVRIHRSKMEEYWGKKPVEAYGATEATGFLSTQAWNAKGLTFWPDVNFLEFIPEEEHLRSREDPSYQPRTVLLDELEAGETYELVVTNLLGGAFVRYRIGDLIRIVSLRDDETGINLPQMVFHSRADGVIDLASFTRLTETDIWQAVEASGVTYVDWTARKEVSESRAVLHVYIEPKGSGENLATQEVKEAVHRRLGEVHEPYRELEEMLEFDPLELTFLPAGSFARYIEAQQKAGADLAHLKPPHMQASDDVMNKLLGVDA